MGNNLSYIAFYKCDGQATGIHDNRVTDIGLRDVEGVKGSGWGGCGPLCLYRI